MLKHKDRDKQTFKIRSYSRIIPRRATHEWVQKVWWRQVGGWSGIVLLSVHNSGTHTWWEKSLDHTSQSSESGVKPYLSPSSCIAVVGTQSETRKNALMRTNVSDGISTSWASPLRKDYSVDKDSRTDTTPRCSHVLTQCWVARGEGKIPSHA